MDSDSESQDSDEGRRFRFEATRKDNVQLDAKLGKLSRSKSEHESGYNDTEHKDKKDKSKRHCNKGEHKFSKEPDSDNDFKHCTRHSKHSVESKNSKHEDDDDHKSVRDAGSDTKGTTLSSKHKTKYPERHKNRSRNEHRSNKSQERCRSRNENDKHRNKSYEKYKHSIRDRSRDKNYQSRQTRSEEHGKCRGESERHNTHKRMLVKEDEGPCLEEEYSSPKNVEQGHNDNESPTKRDVSLENQEYKDELNLSEFDILSETDENTSDCSDIKDKNSLSRQCNKKSKKRNFNNECDNLPKKQAKQIEPMEGSLKVNARKNNMLYGSSNNNSGTISDSSLGTTSPILTESRKNIVDLNSEEESLNVTEQTSLHPDNYDSVKAADVHSSETCIEKCTTYGPALPPQLTVDSSISMESNEDNVHFIGPCLSKNDAQDTSARTEKATLHSINDPDNTMQNDMDVVFGPALPPHLLKQKYNKETNTKIIGPTLPNTMTSFNDNKVNNQIESEDEDEGIGPLPVNHPALESNYVQRQLEQRAQLIKNEQKNEVRPN